MPGRRKSSMSGDTLLGEVRSGQAREFAEEEAAHPFQAPTKQYEAEMHEILDEPPDIYCLLAMRQDILIMPWRVPLLGLFTVLAAVFVPALIIVDDLQKGDTFCPRSGAGWIKKTVASIMIVYLNFTNIRQFRHMVDQVKFMYRSWVFEHYWWLLAPTFYYVVVGTLTDIVVYLEFTENDNPMAVLINVVAVNYLLDIDDQMAHFAVNWKGRMELLLKRLMLESFEEKKEREDDQDPLFALILSTIIETVRLILWLMTIALPIMVWVCL